MRVTNTPSENTESRHAVAANGMSVERARVISVESGRDSHGSYGQKSRDSQDSHFLWVETFQQSTCGSCEARDGCGQGVMNKWFQREGRCFKVACSPSEINQFAVGQWVEIGMPDGLVLKASLVAYLSPLFGFIAGAVAMESIIAGDLGALLGGVAGFIIGLGWVRYYARLQYSKPEAAPRLLWAAGGV